MKDNKTKYYFSALAAILVLIVTFGADAISWNFPWNKESQEPKEFTAINGENKANQQRVLKSGLKKIDSFEKLLNNKFVQRSKELFLELTQEELQALFIKELSVMKESPIESRSIKVLIDDGELRVSGNVLKPIRGEVTVGLTGDISSGKIEPHLSYLKVGYFRFPSGLAESQIRDRLPKDWEKLLNPSGIKWSIGSLDNGILILRGTIAN